MNLSQVIALTFAYYNRGQVPTDAIIAMYTEDLADLSPTECIRAYRCWRLNPHNKFFPLPAQIRGMLSPQLDDDSQARDAASRIISSVSKFGWPNSTEAKEYMGDLAWHIVDRYGGWEYICQNLGVTLDIGTFQAQARDAAKAQLAFGNVGLFDRPPGLPLRANHGLTQIGDIVGLLPGPEGNK